MKGYTYHQRGQINGIIHNGLTMFWKQWVKLGNFENENRSVKLNYCCEYPNQWLFQDSQGEKITAVVHCSSCQRIAAEIPILNPSEEE